MLLSFPILASSIPASVLPVSLFMLTVAAPPAVPPAPTVAMTDFVAFVERASTTTSNFSSSSLEPLATILVLTPDILAIVLPDILFIDVDIPAPAVPPTPTVPT